MSKLHRIPESGNAPGPVVLDSTAFPNSLSPILESLDDSGNPAGEAGKRGYSQSADQAASKIDSLISTLEIPQTWALDGGLTGLAEAAARIGIHLDSTFLEKVTANAGSWHSAVRFGNGGITWPAAATDRAAATAATPTEATVASSSLLAASAVNLTFETRVAAAGDDIEQKASGSIASNVTDLELGVDGTTSQTVGLRFTGIDIPQGAIITSAYIQFQANEVKTGAASLLIKGEDSDDAGVFTAVKFNVSARTTTDASTAWAPDPWTTEGAHGLAERTPDLTAIVQEIVNRSGWAALNDMAFLITGTGTRTANSYEYSPTGAPLLHIEYQLPSLPVAFNTPPDTDPVANQIAELAAAGAPIGITASAADPDAGTTITYSLNDARFAIDASSGIVTRSAIGTLDFETQPSINLTVTATSSDGSTANQNFTIAVLNNPEPVAFNAPPDADTAVNRIAQNAAAGTAIGITASAKDSDAGSTVTYSIDDARFAINPSTGVITRSNAGTLNAQSEPSVNLTVTATSSDGSTDTHAFNVSITGAAPVIIETRVAAAGDDVEQKASGSISSNVTDLELGLDGTTSQTVGLRFTGIDIPKGAIITSAYIQFQANEVKTGATSLLVKGEDSDDSSPFTAVNFNVSSRATTDASSAWTPDPWTTVGAHGTAERTPDLTAIVQEIVNRSGWSALNDMAFLITGTGTRTADSFEYSPTGAPLLHIEYLPPSPPVAFNTPADADPVANQIAELAAAGAPIGITASAADPDAGSTVTYSLNDTRFAIDAGSWCHHALRHRHARLREPAVDQPDGDGDLVGRQHRQPELHPRRPQQSGAGHLQHAARRRHCRQPDRPGCRRRHGDRDHRLGQGFRCRLDGHLQHRRRALCHQRQHRRHHALGNRDAQCGLGAVNQSPRHRHFLRREHRRARLYRQRCCDGGAADIVSVRDLRRLWRHQSLRRESGVGDGPWLERRFRSHSGRQCLCTADPRWRHRPAIP